MKRDRLDRRKEKYQKRSRELEKRLQKAIDYKARILWLEQDSLAEYRKDRISYSEYERRLVSEYEGKSREQWISYYDDYITSCKKDLEETKQALDKIDRELGRDTKVTYGLWIAVIVAIVGLAFAFGPQITGFVVAPANVSVVNVAPNVTALTITPAPAYTNTTLNCNPTTEDWNDDAVTSHYNWFSNNSGTFEKLTWTTSNLVGGNFTGTNNITCQVIPSDGPSGLNGTADNASIFIDNRAPVVTLVEITDNATDFGYVVNPVAGQNAIVAIRVSVNDGSCSNENNVTAYICDTSIANECSNSVFNYSRTLTFQRLASGSTCYFTYNGTQNLPEFWRAGGTFNITAYAVDNSSGAQLTDNNYTGFTYNSLQAIDYTTRIYLGNSSSLTLGEWATNATAVNLTNFGNVLVSLEWNVSNATRLGGGDEWKITNDFLLDDDKIYTAPTEDTLISFANLSNTLISFNQTSGLETCDADECDNGIYSSWARNETLETYFHIKPPTGLLSGTYSSSLWIVTTAV